MSQPLSNVSNISSSPFLQHGAKALSAIGDESIRYAGPRRLIKKKKDAAALHAATQQANNTAAQPLITAQPAVTPTVPARPATAAQHSTPAPAASGSGSGETDKQAASIVPMDDEVGSMLGDYQLMEAIGRGGFGVVYRGLNVITGRTVAIKRISLYGIPADELEGIEAEITLLKNLVHTNIVLYYDSIRTDRHLNIVLEYAENGSLSTLLNKMGGKLPEPLVSHYTAQVLNGLHYLHTQGVIHRDIKGANILATKDGSIKLADFGVATKLNETIKSDSVVGTPYWMAPEIIEMSGQQSSSCDIWSVGCTVIELLTGKPPYFDMAQMPALFRIVQDEHPPLPDNISPPLQDFLLQCFQKDPNRRIDAQGLLRHSWLKKTMDKMMNEKATNGSVAGKTSVHTMKPVVEALDLDSDEDWDAEIEEEAGTHTQSNGTGSTKAQLITPDVIQQLLNKQAVKEQQQHTAEQQTTSPSRSASLAMSPTKLPYELSPFKPSELLNGKAVVTRKASAVQANALMRLEMDDQDTDDATILDDIDDDNDVVLPSSSVKQDTVRRTAPQMSIKPRGLKEFMETDGDDNDYEFDDDVSDNAGGERHLTLARHAQLPHMQAGNTDDIFDDTFDTSISETSINSVRFHNNELDENNVGEQVDPVIVKQLTRLVNALVPMGESAMLLDTLNSITAIVQQNTGAAAHMNTIGATQLIDMASHTGQAVVFAALKLINIVSSANPKLQYTLCLNGLLPVMCALCDEQQHAADGVLTAADLVYISECVTFCHTLLHSNTDVCKQLFMSCNGVRVLVQAMKLTTEQVTHQLHMLSSAVDCVNYLLTHTSVLTKNTLCRLFVKSGLLPALTAQLHHVLVLQHSIPSQVYKQTSTQMLAILTLFSNADQTVKQAYSASAVINNILLILQLNYRQSAGGKPSQLVDNNTITTLLKTIKNISMDSTTLDNLESTCTIPTLLLYLPASNAAEHQTTVLLTMYYLCQIKQSRQEQAAVHGIVPHLMRIIRDNSPLKQFAYPIVMLLGKSTPAARVELKKHSGVDFYLWCLSDIYWCVQALEALCVWLAHDKARVEHALQQRHNVLKLVKCFQVCGASAQQYESILPIIRKIVSDSVGINLALGGNVMFIRQLADKLQQTSGAQQSSTATNNMRVNLLKIIALLVIPTDSVALKHMQQCGLVPVLQVLAKDDSSVIVEKLAQKLLDTRFHVTSPNATVTAVKKSLVTARA